MQREKAPQFYKVLVLKGNDIQLSHSDRGNSNGAPDMMHVEENKIVIDSVNRASGDNITVEVTKY